LAVGITYGAEKERYTSVKHIKPEGSPRVFSSIFAACSACGRYLVRFGNWGQGIIKTEDADDPRTTAMGLLTDSKQMLAAAIILQASGDVKVQRPTYYLLGHAIELVLKSFLLANGDSQDRLRRRIGHDLRKAAQRVITAKNDPISKVVADNLVYIEMLNPYYLAKELEYRVTGYKTYPPQTTLLLFLKEIIPMIEPLALEAYQSSQT
jgi:hypothetical protein